MQWWREGGLVLLVAGTVGGFSMVEEGQHQQVLEGEDFTILCKTDSFYEFCVFVSPIGERCEFEWKRKRWNISRSSCPELEARTSFSGVYEDFQCGLRVEGARTRDGGIWGCEMESYKFGGGRGSGYVVSGGVEITVSKPTTTTTTTERTTRSALWLGEVKFTDREGRRLGDWDLGFSGPSLPSLPSKKDLAIAAIDLAGLFPIFVTGGVIVVFITMFSLLVVAHKRKAAAGARVKSLQKVEQGRKEEDNKAKVLETVMEAVNDAVKVDVHKEEVLFMRRVFPHIISISESDLGLNL